MRINNTREKSFLFSLFQNVRKIFIFIIYLPSKHEETAHAPACTLVTRRCATLRAKGPGSDVVLWESRRHRSPVARQPPTVLHTHSAELCLNVLSVSAALITWSDVCSALSLCKTCTNVREKNFCYCSQCFMDVFGELLKAVPGFRFRKTLEHLVLCHRIFFFFFLLFQAWRIKTNNVLTDQ